MGRYGFSLAWHNHLAACSAAFKINSTQVRFGRPENTWHTWNIQMVGGVAGAAITVSIFASETNCTLIAHVQLKANAKQRDETKEVAQAAKHLATLCAFPEQAQLCACV